RPRAAFPRRGPGAGRRQGMSTHWTGPARERSRAGPCPVGWRVSGAEFALEDLAGGGHRQFVTELDLTRVLVRGQTLLGPFHELLRGDVGTRFGDHERLDLLTVGVVRETDD